MNLALNLTDQRTKADAYSYANPKTEDYTRAEINIGGNAALVAATLRALANEIDPPRAAAKAPYYTINNGGLI